MGFKEDKDFEEHMSYYIDSDIYPKYFEIDRIERSDRVTFKNAEMMLKDKELSIDVTLYLKSGMKITVQEKTRRYEYLKYNDFTIEYYNNPKTKEKGEWFKLCSDLYLYGVANKEKTGYVRYCLINVFRLKEFLSKKDIVELERKYKKQNSAHSRASFFAIPFDDIPDYCIEYQEELLNCNSSSFLYKNLNKVR
jgi:hypothetical protein